ncbi:MEKHLA domain-containing protein [Tuwongella immobilis]|uniref:MEKHLA domain-containing protein n=1 Tax=Tuwongella immobilis TaxID=692036 RepID=A0A6C2YPF5_9BACT|nr:MEKHLA domain-containing protein [Tuwongella immobilis]VIP02762.1 MEKHLA domain-containing protein OS=Gloeocapsa sp. PCC 73106 GN=GLO73106DRAFT_00014000 PE=4 SV=1: MEKHLA [Tuwongella immobilis]VTS02375.1 MEKHLA domain-containing protein OS=Gloeocapsa sp. PCC 73106 GN=GLO73106DRAFT_00014000 PE=4 SV=1: MEKHLA [Tuwongella immobilis]
MVAEDSSNPPTHSEVVAYTQLLLDSYEHWLKVPLVDRSGSAQEQAHRLFHAPFVAVSHRLSDDPILCYGNQTALNLWQMDFATFTQTPSRFTAEPMHRDERQRLLEATQRDGHIRNYQGIRIASTGRRFRIENVIVWNVLDTHGAVIGQAATFAEWVFLD